MIRINLLPHREARRIKNKRAFVRMLILSAVFAGVVVFVVGAFIAEKISEQMDRNTFITEENKRLDKQIEEIATLKQDIEALKARQQAVEDLQSDRNQPAYLLDELVKQVPEGVYLNNFKQEGQKVSMTGFAQSNDRISELLHNFNNNSPWLEHPELIESKASSTNLGKQTKRVYEFSMSVGIKRLREKDKASTEKNPGSNAGDKSKSSDAIVAPTDKPGDKPNDKPVEKPADSPAKPEDKSVPATDKLPATGDKPAAVKGASDAVKTGAAADAPKKP